MRRLVTRPRVLIPALAALAILALAPVASADYEQVGNFAESGSGAQLLNSRGVAVNIDGAGGVEAGSVYVASRNRVSRYSPTGEIKEVWGLNTIASGPDLPNQVSTLTVSATSGSYELTAQTASGRAAYAEGSKLFTEVTTEVGAFHVGDVMTGPFGSVPKVPGPGVEPLSATITKVGVDTLEVSSPTLYRTGGVAQREAITASETTAPISYGASAAEVEAALVALPAFDAGDVSVIGGPGDAGGTTPYEITFAGAYVGSPVALSVNGSTLAGGTPTSGAKTATITRASKSGYQRCRVDRGDRCVSQETSTSPSAEEVGEFTALQGVAVDQSTGYVYLRNSARNPGETRVLSGRAHDVIEVFSADGSESIARFGDLVADKDETLDESPEKLHGDPSYVHGIAVGGGGDVYLTDNVRSIHGGYESARVMCFEPDEGNYKTYKYCGRSRDLNLPVSGNYLSMVSLDDAGHIYVGTEQRLEEYSLADLTQPPLCTFQTNGQAMSMTVNPATGEVFYFNGTKADERIHRLAPCDPEVGKFKEAQASIAVVPPTQNVLGLAVNPSLVWGPERPAGVIYGADAEWHRGETPAYVGIGDIFAPAEVHPPTILSESVSNTRTASALLRAEINPHGFGTHYVFQYLTQAQYEANEPGERFAGAGEAPLGGGEIGGGAVGQAAVAVSGLAPETAYRFRVIATSECDVETGEPCVTVGEATSFSTYPDTPAGLPDHRAYELVSPAQKQGGQVFPAEPRVRSCLRFCKPETVGNVFPMQSAPDGEAVVYEGLPFSQTEGPVLYTSYLSRRTAAGWQTTMLDPALQKSAAAGHVAFDTSLEQGLLKESGEIGVASPIGANLYAQSTAAPGALQPLVAQTPPNRGSKLAITYAGHSADFSRIFFAANDSLTGATPYAPEPPDPGSAKKDLYEWHEGVLTVVNVLPGNASVAAGAKFASLTPFLSPDTHAISADGSKVFFEDEAGALYVREVGQVTRQIADPGHFLSASPDGSVVLLTDGCLYSMANETCTDLTAGHGGFLGLAGESTNLSHLYFVDTAVLAGNEGAAVDSEGNPQQAEAGKNNLYSWSGGEAHFIAALQDSDEENTAYELIHDWAPSPAKRTAEASPSGRFLAFMSKASLTGYDNLGLCGSVLISEPGEPEQYGFVPTLCGEVFLYDSATGKLNCPSCDPTGEAPLGKSTLRRLAGAPEGLPQPRYLTDEGRLYFDSQNSLVARDTNEGVEDVYEYEPAGAGREGTCGRSAGCVFLISAGTGPVDSNLVAVDESGGNVFFDTRDQLSLKDNDELLDLYDAREGGGIAAETEVAQTECQGEACQPPVSAPNDATPASAAFEGAGNVKEGKAKKQQHRKKKHRRHKKRHRHHAHKHGKGHKHGKKHGRKHEKNQRHAKRHGARGAKRNHGGAK